MKPLPKLPEYPKQGFPGEGNLTGDEEKVTRYAGRFPAIVELCNNHRITHFTAATEAVRERIQLLREGLAILKDETKEEQKLPELIDNDVKLNAVGFMVAAALKDMRTVNFCYHQSLNEVLTRDLAHAGAWKDGFVTMRAAAKASDKIAAAMIEKVVAYDSMATTLLNELRVRAKIIKGDKAVMTQIKVVFEKGPQMEVNAEEALKGVAKSVEEFKKLIAEWSENQKKPKDDNQTTKTEELKKKMDDRLKKLTAASERFRTPMVSLRTLGLSLKPMGEKLGSILKKNKVQTMIDKLAKSYSGLLKKVDDLQKTIDGFRNTSTLPENIKNHLPKQWDKTQ
ncbi:hypothetical protein [Limnoglobus roseus]|uniref:Uncharacterized protein n=1 Tax=Limnoglobus roseus TaxID=2598579 RepID=A0A5C1AJH2_9BACT|nr:hypothetical protein [Limnoglobus roseus]QEL19010.1 hypothetical protein PX52LOC_06060 [Limnoglobus roseus]